MAYQWDVFLSYRRSNDWPRFVEKLFLPMFKHWLDEAVGESSKIFFDAHDIETGEQWPSKLADALAHSKTMVSLWSREYFKSKWCASELEQMLARRNSVAAGPYGRPPIVLAVVIHDCEHVDQSVADIQRYSLKGLCDPWIAEGSLMAEKLSREIESLARDVADALGRAPAYDDAWRDLITQEFNDLFNDTSTQQLPPSLG
jgi:TIR domain